MILVSLTRIIARSYNPKQLRFTDALVLQACNFRSEPFALLKLQHNLGCLPLPVVEGTRYHHTKHTKDDCDDALWSLYKLGGQNGTIGTTSTNMQHLIGLLLGKISPWQFGQLVNANWTTFFGQFGPVCSPELGGADNKIQIFVALEESHHPDFPKVVSLCEPRGGLCPVAQMPCKSSRGNKTVKPHQGVYSPYSATLSSKMAIFLRHFLQLIFQASMFYWRGNEFLFFFC